VFIKKIRLLNYRNYNNSYFEFTPEGCLITGKNGIGKTNLLEGICYSAFGKSVRQFSDSDLINFKENNFSLKAKFIKDGRELNYSISLNDKKKSITLNNSNITRVSDLYNYVKVVYLSAEDIWLINGTRQKRRNFFDQAITQTSVLYGETIRDYYRILEQRNAILKDESKLELLDLLTKQFVEKAIEVYEYRQNYLQRFIEFTEDILNEITDSMETVGIDYYAQNRIEYNKEFLIKYLHEHKKIEIDSKRTIIGPHLDEYELKINGFLAKRYSSQGQKRSLAIALRFAQIRMINESIVENPIIIFDDALSELDKNRVARIFNLFNDEHQILIASPNTENYATFNFPIINLQERITQNETK
jgi:DNA replication and repair protein RecF